MYYQELENVDKALEKIVYKRDRKLKKLLKKYDKVLAKAGEETEAVLLRLGKHIPNEVKQRRNHEV